LFEKSQYISKNRTLHNMSLYNLRPVATTFTTNFVTIFVTKL